MSTEVKVKKEKSAAHGKCMMTRRGFLMTSGAATAVSTVGVSLFPGAANAFSSTAQVIGYPRKKIASLKQLKDNQPFDFSYPDDVQQPVHASQNGRRPGWRWCR